MLQRAIIWLLIPVLSVLGGVGGAAVYHIYLRDEPVPAAVGAQPTEIVEVHVVPSSAVQQPPPVLPDPPQRPAPPDPPDAVSWTNSGEDQTAAPDPYHYPAVGVTAGKPEKQCPPMETLDDVDLRHWPPDDQLPAAVRESVGLLNQEYRSLKVGKVELKINGYYPVASDWQPTIVGVLDTFDYIEWEQLTITNPEALVAWLEAATRRVERATTDLDFELAWAVMEKVSRRPRGFWDHELWPLGDCRQLLIRPLAWVNVQRFRDDLWMDISLRPVVGTVWHPLTGYWDPYHIWPEPKVLKELTRRW